ncbi:MAG: ABC transporter substrate-binding protein [Rhodospirillaceae bacterium]|jgi:branched-chain amino acid transport system substrate-binding protein|nr:ABC transporter substrate-binding protein [Rhodospirillaceae bacterium]MBT4043922.1 ABC transporter substrate-binding protein [Rhodospirillaceae bacterium]MBT4691451.1 ABC transporter substrate-binding protein [Rhodospirillaceae bacterium]MBT5082954.1 ABC transporter substrate-binding protein [Rhodospirillaceae bacterium]MBT5524398.1 ABC transporter substrate-binding protein [Rhodospirillaceae bacterium]
MSKRILGMTIALAMATTPVAAETVKVGFITTLSGGAAIIGKPMKNAFELGMEHVGGKLGGMDTEIIFGDDKRKPDVAKQLANKMVKKDRVDFVTGIIWSNLLIAIHGPVTRSKTFLISSNAGPSAVAGKKCSEDFFNVAFQNDMMPEGMGQHMSAKKIDNVYIMAPNYQAGKDMMKGFKRTFNGKIAGEVYTKLGQKDYQAEISALRAAKPTAVFVFLPGGMGINFIKQYAQAGLSDKIPLYSAYTVDAISLPALKEAAVGTFGVQHWSPDLGNSVNRRFVEGYRKKYGKTPPFYAAQAYDTVMFLDNAIRKAGGISDRAKLRAAMRAGDFPTTRGTFKFNNNHFPIQNIYLREAVNDNGNYVTKTRRVIISAHGDSYAKSCPMKW